MDRVFDDFAFGGFVWRGVFFFWGGRSLLGEVSWMGRFLFFCLRGSFFVFFWRLGCFL